MSEVADLDGFRRRRAVRQAGAYLVITWGVLTVLAQLWAARRRLDDAIRRAADLLPKKEEEAA